MTRGEFTPGRIFDLPRHQRPVGDPAQGSRPAVVSWLVRHDAQVALPTVTILEIAFGIRTIHPDQRAVRLEEGLSEWRRRFADRIFGLTEAAALAWGDIMGAAARGVRGMSAPVGMIAAIPRVNGGRLATRNRADFVTTGLELISPWDL